MATVQEGILKRWSGEHNRVKDQWKETHSIGTVQGIKLTREEHNDMKKSFILLVKRIPHPNG